MRLAEIEYEVPDADSQETNGSGNENLKMTYNTLDDASEIKLDFPTIIQRSSQQDFTMDVYTGEFIEKDSKPS